MARLLAAHIEPAEPHFLDDITVADAGAHNADAAFRKPSLQAEVGHHCRHQRPPRQTPRRRQPPSDQRHELVAVD